MWTISTKKVQSISELISSDHYTEEMRDILIRNILIPLCEGSTYESRYLSFSADGTNARRIVSYNLELHLKNVSMRTMYWAKHESSSAIWIWLTFDICVFFNSEWNKRGRENHIVLSLKPNPHIEGINVKWFGSANPGTLCTQKREAGSSRK